MAMQRAQKEEAVEGLHKTFTESDAVILLTFKGVNVPNITDLRRKIRDAGSHYEVVKNTLALRAAQGPQVDQLKDFFSGPTAIAYTLDDPITLAKILRDFVKGNQGMDFKAGVLGGKLLSEVQVKDLAELPSREEMLSKLLYLLNAPLSRLAGALKSPLRDLAFVLKQLAEKK